MHMGGEASLPFYYAKLFLRVGQKFWFACHERVETELRTAFPELEFRMRFVRDTPAESCVRCGNVLPYRLRDILISQGIHFSTQMRIRAVANESHVLAAST